MLINFLDSSVEIMKLCLLLVIGVFVGLAASQYCKKDEFDVSDLCMDNCRFKAGHNWFIGKCKVSSTYKSVKAEGDVEITRFIYCWKCYHAPL